MSDELLFVCTRTLRIEGIARIARSPQYIPKKIAKKLFLKTCCALKRSNYRIRVTFCRGRSYQLSREISERTLINSKHLLGCVYLYFKYVCYQLFNAHVNGYATTLDDDDLTSRKEYKSQKFVKSRFYLLIFSWSANSGNVMPI